MSERMRPAWARDSMVLRFDRAPRSGTTPTLWDFADATGDGVRVAVVDSGIDAGHPQLDGCVDEGSAIEFTVDAEGEVVATPGPHGDAFGHGTAVAGIIHGLAPRATITSVRVLGPNLSGKAAAFLAGLTWAIDQGYDIVNLSLGTTRAEWALAFHEACDRAYFGGTFVVTAANNVQRSSYPSLFASVASVACNLSSDPWRYHVNPNPPTEFLARGIDIEVPWLNGGTTVTTGNSFAAPHIAGLAALVKSKHPELRPFQVKAALWANAANVREASQPEPAGRRATIMMTGMAKARDTLPPMSRGDSDDAVPGYELVGTPTALRGGICWPATRTADGAPVSVLRVTAMTRDDAAAVTRLRQDLARLDGLRHPHVLRTRAVIDRPWIGIVTDRIPPGAVAARALPATQAVAAVLAVCAALDAAHRIGCTTGDLSVDALVLGGGGLAVHPIALVATGARGAADIATLDPRQLAYVAPEQLGGSGSDGRDDVYGVSVLLHRLLTGVVPYDDTMAIGRYLKNRLTEPPRALDGPVSDDLAALLAVVAEGLALDPARRPVDLDDLARRLLAALRPDDPDGAVAALVATGLVDASIVPGRRR